MSNLRLIGLASVLAASFGSAAHGVMVLPNGQSVSLAAVLDSNDHKVSIGDKIFTFGPYTSDTFVSSGIFVTAFIANNPLDGIGFDLTGGFGDVNPSDGLPAAFHLAYSVEVNPEFLGQGYRLKDVGLLFNGAANGAGSSATVHEAISDATPGPVGALDVSALGGGAIHQQDFHNFLPQTFTRFGVTTDAAFLAANNDGSASASFIRQTFSQTIIPAPGAAALAACGGLIAVRRRRALRGN